jgi:hypothetical protein
MALALLANTNESHLKDLEEKGKLCSTCDPDVPGHVERSKCPTCKGKGIEPCSFARTAAEIKESKSADETKNNGKGISKGKGKSKNQPAQTEDDDDAALYLEY